MRMTISLKPRAEIVAMRYLELKKGNWEVIE